MHIINGKLALTMNLDTHEAGRNSCMKLVLLFRHNS